MRSDVRLGHCTWQAHAHESPCPRACATSSVTVSADIVAGELLHLNVVQVGSFLLQHEQEVQRESVDLHSLSAKEARAAVLCILCNIQVCLASHLPPAEASADPIHAKSAL
jgi:formate/nitrite transporter FocA (FNT family)